VGPGCGTLGMRSPLSPGDYLLLLIVVMVIAYGVWTILGGS
jgi:hypothetical protein